MRHFSKIEDAVQSDPQLSSDYRMLRDIDTDYDSKLSDVLDSTLCAFKEISDNFFLDQTLSSNVLYVVLGAIHYRSNKVAGGGFLKQSEDFIRKATDKIGLSETVIKMLQSEDAYGMSKIYEACKNKTNSKENKKILAFLALTIFLSDFYITVKRNPDGFYEKYIKEKATNRLNDSVIKAEISGNTISFDVDVERRSLRITVRCSTANSHKAMSLIVKEFELILSKFEEDFASVGFRVYYVLPIIMKSGNDDDKLESYEFGAYIPRLIPLLAGNNIYSEPEAFTRELIQNSIDAIKVRAKREEKDISELGKIKLEINEGNDTNPGYFRNSDEGTGMNRYVLERYLTTIGRSFYTSSDFDKLNVEYSPISQFGIGFLSCFMLGKHVEVRTTYFENTNEEFSLDIPNYDGYFFIESKKEGEHKAGSCITVWENLELRESSGYTFDIKRIKEYVKTVICDIPFDITNNGRLFLPKFCFRKELEKRTKTNKLLFFIPLESNPDESGKTIVKKMPAETTYIYTEHGIYFYKIDDALFGVPKRTVMNNGILVGDTPFDDDELYNVSPYLDVAYNLPSHSLELEVSRDKLKYLKDFDVISIKKLLTEKIHNYFKNDEAKSLKYAVWCLLDYANNNLSQIKLSFEDKILIVKYGTHTLNDEVENLRVLLEGFNHSISNIRDSNPDRINELRNSPNIYPHHLYFSIDELYLNIRKKVLKKMPSEDLFKLLNDHLFVNNYNDITGHMRYFEEHIRRMNNYSLSKLTNGFIVHWLLETTSVRHRNPYLDKLSLGKQSIIIFAGLKFMLSMLLSYEDLEKGIEIPIDMTLHGDYDYRNE
jgi:hypothetical protein